MDTIEDFITYIRSCKPFICWFKSRKVFHIINNPDDTHTLCGIKRNYIKGTAARSSSIINICKRCKKINEAIIYKYRNT